MNFLQKELRFNDIVQITLVVQVVFVHYDRRSISSYGLQPGSAIDEKQRHVHYLFKRHCATAHRDPCALVSATARDSRAAIAK